MVKLFLVKFVVLISSCTCYRAVPIAMDRAVKEIVSGIVQRSVSIATQTTKELVLKVFSINWFDWHAPFRRSYLIMQFQTSAELMHLFVLYLVSFRNLQKFFSFVFGYFNCLACEVTVVWEVLAVFAWYLLRTEMPLLVLPNPVLNFLSLCVWIFYNWLFWFIPHFSLFLSLPFIWIICDGRIMPWSQMRPGFLMQHIWWLLVWLDVWHTWLARFSSYTELLRWCNLFHVELIIKHYGWSFHIVFFFRIFNQFSSIYLF